MPKMQQRAQNAYIKVWKEMHELVRGLWAEIQYEGPVVGILNLFGHHPAYYLF
jgi:hypothetical protein